MAKQRFLPSTLALWILVVLAGCSGSSPAIEPPDSSDPVVASIADTTLSLSELGRAYAEANDRPAPSSDSLSAYEDFLEQYVNYRLKLRAAHDAGLDTLTSVQRELRSYRDKMARPKLMREKIYEPLVRTVYERRQEEVDVSHILKRVSPDAPPEDTLAAHQQLTALADSIEQGASFAELAYRHSDDPSAQKDGQRGHRGRLGYIRAGQIVEPFEDRMYRLPPDSVSDVFRTQFGYHLLKVHDRRPTQPPVRLSHIMIRPDGDSTRTKQLLDSLRTQIVEQDADFGALAEKYSDDQQSAPRGGDLGRVESIQSLPPSFRRVVPRLDSVGAVSDVVKSQYGFHLIQLTDRDAPPPFEDAYDDIKEILSERPRVQRRKTQFARSVRSDAGSSVDTSRILKAVDAPSVDTLSRSLLALTNEETEASVDVATIGDSTYTLEQLARHVMQTDGGTQMTIGEVIEDFLNDKAFHYATARLETRDSSFAATMQKYREGLLVYQFMQDSVWTAAAQDSAGLRQTYRQQKDEYRHPDRVRTIVLRAPADSLLAPYASAYSDTSPLASVLDDVAADSLVAVDTIMVTEESPEVYRPILSVEDGSFSGPTEHEGESIVLIRDALLPARPKTFEEARSSVIRDHQDRYEDEVLSRLRRRYDANTYPDRLRQALTDDPSRSTP